MRYTTAAACSIRWAVVLRVMGGTVSHIRHRWGQQKPGGKCLQAQCRGLRGMGGADSVGGDPEQGEIVQTCFMEPGHAHGS